MKTQIVYFLAVLLISTFVSCEDQEEVAPVQGQWTYQSPYFIFGYSQDSLSIETMPGQKKSIAVKQIRGMFMGIAAEKMGAYFKGIEFTDPEQLQIQIRMGQREIGLGANYVQGEDFIQIALDTNDLKMLTQGTAPQIPALSFKYKIENNRLCLYLTRNYIITMVYMMQGTLTDLLVSMIAKDIPENIRPMVIPKIKASLEKQIPVILDNITELEVGFYLQKN